MNPLPGDMLTSKFHFTSRSEHLHVLRAHMLKSSQVYDIIQRNYGIWRDIFGINTHAFVCMCVISASVKRAPWQHVCLQEYFATKERKGGESLVTFHVSAQEEYIKQQQAVGNKKVSIKKKNVWKPPAKLARR